MATRRSRERKAERERLAREENQNLRNGNQELREGIQELREVTQNLRYENQELLERVRNLKAVVADKDNVGTGLKNELKRLQRRIMEAEARERLADAEKLIAEEKFHALIRERDEEIHALRERVSELEATYLGGYRD